MRTTVNLDRDVEAAVATLRSQRGVGLSEAVNELIRQGLSAAGSKAEYVHRTAPLGITMDISNVAEVLDLLDREG